MCWTRESIPTASTRIYKERRPSIDFGTSFRHFATKYGAIFTTMTNRTTIAMFYSVDMMIMITILKMKGVLV